MVICPKCCEYYRFQDALYDRKNNRYICVFSCDCPAPLRLEEADADQKGFFVEDEVQDAFRERKIEIIQDLIRERVIPPVSTAVPSLMPGPTMTRRPTRDEPSPS